MTKEESKKIVLPALRGVMGRWVYYSCLMNLRELSDRVDYAEAIHRNEHLSDMIQRQLKRNRGSEIAEYLKSQPERFFNSLVVATYKGEPSWYGLADVKSRTASDLLDYVSEETVSSVGFLTLRGDEKLFALDGQHRLAGIKKAVKEGVEDNPYDVVSVIFVAHHASTKGMERTRRLFTTLNKTARPVSKGDIIALDEDDVMAISVRWLIEESGLFEGKRIAFVASNNMPVGNIASLTTIANLYDILTILFTDASSDLKKKKSDLQRVRPNDDELKEYFKLSNKYFIELKGSFKELEEFFNSKDTEKVVKKYRNAKGGNALFRPLGLDIFTRIIARLSKKMEIDKAIAMASRLPRQLDERPYRDLMWDPSNETILNSHKVTLREVLLYMLDSSKYSDDNLLARYRKETGNDQIELPEKVV